MNHRSYFTVVRLTKEERDSLRGASILSDMNQSEIIRELLKPVFQNPGGMGIKLMWVRWDKMEKRFKEEKKLKKSSKL